MVANLTLAAFLGGLVVSLVFGFPLVCALLFGLVLFIAYARYMKIGVRNIAMLLAVGIKKSKNILRNQNVCLFLKYKVSDIIYSR